MKCPNCGKSIPEGIRFCGHCGMKLESMLPKGILDQPIVDEKGTLEKSVPKKDAKPKKIPLWFFGVLIFSLIAISGILYFEFLAADEHWIECVDFGYSKDPKVIYFGLENEYLTNRRGEKVHRRDRFYFDFDWGTKTESQASKFLEDTQLKLFLNDQLFDSNQNCQKYTDTVKDENDKVTSVVGGFRCFVDSKVMQKGINKFNAEFSWSNKVFDGEVNYGPGTENEKIIGTCSIYVYKIY